MKTLAILFFGFFVSSFATADQAASQSNLFNQKIQQYKVACTPQSCTAPYSQQVAYDNKARFNRLPLEIKQSLFKIAYSQAQVWGDTILEGDYHAINQIRLDSVVSLYEADQLIGYRIIYSAKAWYTGDCNFTGRNETLAACKAGRIVEGSYVAADMKNYFGDDERRVEFSIEEK